MIHRLLMPDEGILILTPEGPLKKEDFEALAALLDPYLEEHGTLQGLLLYAESFPGWADFAGLLAHLKFVKNHHQHIAKIAAVTDSSFLSIMPRITSHFVYAEVRHFAYDDKESALTWLQSHE